MTFKEYVNSNVKLDEDNPAQMAQIKSIDNQIKSIDSRIESLKTQRRLLVKKKVDLGGMDVADDKDL